MNKSERKINKELQKYNLKTDGFRCPLCGNYTLLRCLNDEDKLKNTPYEKWIDADRAYKCLNNDGNCFYGNIEDF